MPNIPRKYDVFVNCPFDSHYNKLFNALIFTIQDCGFKPRCALEIDDAGKTRFDKITKIISECKYGIHDISNTELDVKNNLPRFNMPLELGLFLGAITYGTKSQKRKKCLILDKDRYRYQKFCSDLAGHDIHPHNEDEKRLITEVRNWLQTCSHDEFIIPSGTNIHDRFQCFLNDLPVIRGIYRIETDDLIYVNFLQVVDIWIRENDYI